MMWTHECRVFHHPTFMEYSTMSWPEKMEFLTSAIYINWQSIRRCLAMVLQQTTFLESWTDEKSVSMWFNNHQHQWIHHWIRVVLCNCHDPNIEDKSWFNPNIGHWISSSLKLILVTKQFFKFVCKWSCPYGLIVVCKLQTPLLHLTKLLNVWYWTVKIH